MKCCKITGLTMLRVVLGAIFIYHGVTKFGAGPEMAGFVGGAFHNLGITFLSQATRLTVLAVVETLAGTLLVLGLFTRGASIAAMVVMLGAMNAKGRGWPAIEIDTIIFFIGLMFATGGAGRCSVDAMRCTNGGCGTQATKSCCGGGGCGTSNPKDRNKGKEVIEA